MADDFFTETINFNNLDKEFQNETRNVILKVYSALIVKGYNPVNQIVGYILSGDPTYITGHNNARTLITKLERDDLLEEFVKFYITAHSVEPKEDIDGE